MENSGEDGCHDQSSSGRPGGLLPVQVALVAPVGNLLRLLPLPCRCGWSLLGLEGRGPQMVFAQAHQVGLSVNRTNESVQLNFLGGPWVTRSFVKIMAIPARPRRTCGVTETRSISRVRSVLRLQGQQRPLPGGEHGPEYLGRQRPSNMPNASAGSLTHPHPHGFCVSA